MGSLLEQQKAFKKRLAAQPVIQRAHVAGPPPPNLYTPIPSQLQDILEPAKKKQKIKKVLPEASPAVGGRHTLSMVYTVINFLKSVEEPQTADDLKRHVGADLDVNPELYQTLTQNNKIDYDTKTHMFSYRPAYNIKTKEDLLALLQEKQDEGGMEVRELKDSYIDVKGVVEELAEAGQIYIIRNKDETPRILFYNDARLNCDFDADFKQMWHDLRAPDETDLPAELDKAGLKTMEVFEKKAKSDEPKHKKSKARNRKVKITNTHLEGIDLTQDYVAPR
ncbi:transcription initiation factor IIE, beta subunit [Basidiobolus meristosporus CBS 931.73]|uniref:Transcription initiation factor IIE subunit beta n=1 Tax=Basidiobolus meristosporus CBS 931.73 TaxID=1314790 RepID=A0A1Y1XTP1_9FUNG|nr:transcription initiation factor IIE, beta subunit [Basidiobolus meristosporus CBS 931.73]|eukprot:ORX88664.1 transcription initiation factor IIE, beta subunit [Basidiobolus meristosporus CBS 931.73]